ncbi:hypothetical protein O3P69_015452 [Scylla paramamosain]|uniref:Uncharacterized protein n=1 Tax=Scylla paramamosain TaxID=85552 RepID=A0AAW0T5G5_SCYPA
MFHVTTLPQTPQKKIKTEIQDWPKAFCAAHLAVTTVLMCLNTPARKSPQRHHYTLFPSPHPPRGATGACRGILLLQMTRTKRVVTSFHPRDPNKDIYYNSPLTPRLSFPTSDHSTTTSATSLQQPNQVAGGPLWDADTLARAAAHLNAALSNFTCVLVSINAIDEELRVKQDSFVNHYYLTIPNDQLKIDLIQNIYYCYEASEGLPLERDHSPLHARLHRLMFFLKCEKKKRLAACLKHDIRANLDQYNLSGIPGSGFGPDAADEVLALLVGADGIKNLDLYY